MKQCPACNIIIEKISGDDTMMCGCEGRPAGGTMEKALRNGGCGLEFNFKTLALLGQGSPGHPANERQVNFITQGHELHEARRKLADELEFTGFSMEQRLRALERNNNNKEEAANYLLINNGGEEDYNFLDDNNNNGGAERKQQEDQEQAQRLVLANEMVLMGFEINACLAALSQHNNNQESALNWLCENVPSQQNPQRTHNPDSVPLAIVRAPSVSMDVITHNTNPEHVAREMQRQQFYDNPNNKTSDITCFRCNGTGVRQTVVAPTTEGKITEDNAPTMDQLDTNLVVPQIPYVAHEVANAPVATLLDLDKLPVAVVFRVASGDADGGEMKRATSLERYQSEEYGNDSDADSDGNEDDDEEQGESKSGGHTASNSITLQTFSEEELGLLRNSTGASTLKVDEGKTNGNETTERTLQRSQSRRKIKQVGKNINQHIMLPPEACWLCDGSGHLSKYFGQLDVAAVVDEGEEAPTCGICWSDPSEFGLSSSCHHVYCCDCLQQCLHTAMDEGNFPAYCPMCTASVTGDKQPPCGKIDGAALSFLSQRDIITPDFQFRFMRQQKEIERLFFRCPTKCGRILLEPKEIVWKGDKNNPYTSPGECECGALVCVTCHQLLQPNQIRNHSCPANRVGKDMTSEELIQLHNRQIRKCPKCSAFIQKNEGCHIMMCGTNAHGNVEEARKRGGCGYEGHWNTYKSLIERNVVNVAENCRKYSSTKKGHGMSMLNSKPGWCALHDKAGEWMELDLKTSMVVTGLQLQGRDCNTPNKKDWWRFKEYNVECSQDRTRWKKVDGGRAFKGGPDSWTITDRMFTHPVRARYIRIVIHSWHEHIAGRVGVVVGEEKDIKEAVQEGKRDGGGGGEEKSVEPAVVEGKKKERKAKVSQRKDPRHVRPIHTSKAHGRAREWALKRRAELQKGRKDRYSGRRK